MILITGKKGFTLMELLVVIGIIIIIVAAIVTVIPGMRQKTQKNATKAFMERLEIAIEQYYDENRTYPLTTIKELKKALQPPSEDRSKQYIEFDDSEINGDDIVDYWGNPFVYTTPGDPKQNTDSYDLYSKGVDGATTPPASPDFIPEGNDADDINNWSR
ncbi:MAG: type II secretion system protein GspG [Candidatus Scalindua sp.]|nr:type II secretion system protein GspG [Candidatus Scalindua sp.]MCR4345224.1 type II secretion system protein GspG [Candidatus Scalindua sp.]